VTATAASISVDTLRQCRDAIVNSGGASDLVSALAERLGLVEATLKGIVAEALDVTPIDNLATIAGSVDTTKISIAEARRRLALQATWEGQIAAVVADPWDLDLQHWLANQLGAWPRLLWGSRTAIETLLDSLNEFDQSTETKTDKLETSYDISREQIELASSPVVKFVDEVVLSAWRAGASDIHLETVRDGLVVKLRIDGVLVTGPAYTASRPSAEVLNRVKVLAALDVSETRVPQDGRFRARVAGRELDFRASIMPSIFGEDAVIRLLDKAQLRGSDRRIELPRLGFDEAVRRQVRALAGEPHGMLLVTGPTGSGKTTTLYAALSEVHSGEQKIITIEDPVEYELPGVLQIPVNERKGLTFAVGLRSILRHDPDTILVGEIRDQETAEIAVQAALTGHLVFTSVHANSAYDVVSRFMHMGVDLFSFMSALNGVVAQRLVRLVCNRCALSVASDETATVLAAEKLSPGDGRFAVAQGCGECRQTGYKGRTAIGEVLRVDEHLRELVIRREPMSRVREYAAKQGVHSLRHRALQLVAERRTTMQEVSRVIGSHD